MLKTLYHKMQHAYPTTSPSKEDFSTISLIGSLKDTRRRITPNNQCLCTQSITGRPMHQMYPIPLCQSCQLDG